MGADTSLGGIDQGGGIPEPDFVLSPRWGTFRVSPSSRTVDRVPGHQVSGQSVIQQLAIGHMGKQKPTSE
jgi:hypothetical protein